MGGTWKVPESRYNQGPYERCWTPLGKDGQVRMWDGERVVWVEPKVYGHPMTFPKGDKHWRDAHRELEQLHEEKSSTYGTGTDPLANFTTIAATANQEPERYVLERIVEKCARALHMIDAGNAADVKEYPDIASLGLCAEALRRRRD